jgi:tetratricopeptide (TPR) repeat protein
VEDDYPHARRYLTDALSIAEELNDVLSLAAANLSLGLVLSWDCQWEEASYHLGKALDVNIAANSLWGIAAIKSHMASWVYDWQGKIDLGFKESYEALQIAEESGDIHTKAFGYSYHGHSCYSKGYLREAEEYLLKGINFFERINDPGNLSFIYFSLGETCFSMGKHVQAREAAERALSVLEQHRISPSSQNMARLALALAKILGGNADIELEPLYGYQAVNKIKVQEGWIPRYLSAILSNVDVKRLSEAEDLIKRAIEADTRNGTRLYLAQDFAHYGELCKRKGDPAMAREKLGKAIEIFNECGADGWVKRYEEELARI